MNRQYFVYSLIFWKGANILWISLILLLHFQYLFMHLSMRQYFWCYCFELRFQIDAIVMII
jgi:hypothetical protein